MAPREYSAGGCMIGGALRFWGLVRELDLGRIRSDFERPLALGIRGAEGSGRHTLARSLLGPDLDRSGVEIGPETAAGDWDAAILVVDGSRETEFATRHVAQDLAARGPLLVVFTHADQAADP